MSHVHVRWQRLATVAIPMIGISVVESAHGRPAPGIDRATALSLMMDARGFLASVDVTLVVDRVDAHSDRFNGQQAWRLAWSPTSSRWEESAVSKEGPPSLSPPATIAVFDAEQQGVAYDTSGAAKVGSVASLHPERYIHDYFMMIGLLPPGNLVGFESNNDAVSLLQDAGTLVMPQLAEVGGVECIVAEWRPSGADPSSPPLIRAAFAPSLGFAQVLREVRANNGAVAQWTSEEFLPGAEGQTALPLRGEYRFLDESGALQSSRTITVAKGPDGAPLLALGNPVDTELLLPPGTLVVDADTNESWTIASSAGNDQGTGLAGAALAPDALAVAAWPLGGPNSGRWLALIGSLALATLLFAWWRVQRLRRSAKAA
jgi:hypothetical protein